MTARVEQLSDVELRGRLAELGESVGPITDTTRDCYQRMLKKRSRQLSDESIGSSSSSKRQKRDDSPVAVRFPKKHRPSHRPHSPYRHHDRPSTPATSRRDTDSPRRLPKLAAYVTPSSIRPVERERDYTDGDGTGLGPSGQLRGTSCVATPMTTPPSLTDKLMQEGGQWLGSAAKWVGESFKQVASKLSDVVSPTTKRRRSHNRSYGPDQYSIPLESVEIGGEIELEHDPKDFNDWGLVPPPVSNPVPSAPPLIPTSTPSAPPPPSHRDPQYEWELLPGDVEICLRLDGTKWQLGRGGFGEVYKGVKDGIDEVAVKVIRLQNTTLSNQFKTEIDMISKLRHKNIVQFYGACLSPPSLFMVTELMQQDLFSALRKEKDAILYRWSGSHGRDVLCGIGTGIHYLHSRRPPVVHRDIKSPNILLHDNIAKIADVGIARTKHDSDMTAQRGFTIAWAAPEVIYRRRATEKIDIWSYGIILWEVVTGVLPGAGRLELPPTTDPHIVDIYNRCTAEEPVLRPTASEVVRTLRNAK